MFIIIVQINIESILHWPTKYLSKQKKINTNLHKKLPTCWRLYITLMWLNARQLRTTPAGERRSVLNQAPQAPYKTSRPLRLS